MKKLILILFCLASFCFIIINDTFASSKKYSAENNRGYRGMLGHLNYMMETCNSLDEEDIVKERQISESKFIYAYNNEKYPEVKEMIECAFQEEMKKMTDYLEETIKEGNHIHREKCKMCINELNRLKRVIGIK